MSTTDVYELGESLIDYIKLLEKLEQDKVTDRLYAKDQNLFVGDTLMLDWLFAPQEQLQSLPKLVAIKERVLQHNFSAIVLLGMGGSSLAVRVFEQCLSRERKPFFIIDTIHPSAIYRLEQEIDIKNTLFIVASKSGSTLEPNLLYHHFLAELIKAKVKDPYAHFMAITDPISSLEQIAAENGFLEGPFGDPLIGGRYSALSAFGVMPALLMDIDVKSLLQEAIAMSARCQIKTPLKDNPGAQLGAFLGLNAVKGRDLLKFYFSKSLKPLGGWLMQLIAESLGKDNKGIVPIIARDDDESYSSSFMHCFIELSDELGFTSLKKRLNEQGSPSLTMALPDRMSIGAHMFKWEIGVSLAGHIMGVNPFDQPDVEKSKLAARAAMDSFGEQNDRAPEASAQEAIESLLKTSSSASYCALLSYLDENLENMALLEDLAHKLEKRLKMPVLVQSGPRYLHSTGQLFKGGKNDGCFLMLTGSYEHDFPSDIKGLTFKDIHLSQALGDQEAMTSAKRKIWRSFMPDATRGIGELLSILEHN